MCLYLVTQDRRTSIISTGLGEPLRPHGPFIKQHSLQVCQVTHDYIAIVYLNRLLFICVCMGCCIYTVVMLELVISFQLE